MANGMQADSDHRQFPRLAIGPAEHLGGLVVADDLLVRGPTKLLRPSLMAMLPRWQMVIDRWATSTGAAVSLREITQSMKLRKWSSLL